MAKSARTIFQLGALVLLLIVFPAASWYYLNSGLQYRRSAMAELKAYGTFPLSSWKLTDGTPLSDTYLSKKMLVAHILPPEGEATLVEEYGKTLKQLHNQFKERDELLFLTLLHGDSIRIANQLEHFTSTYELFDQDQQLFVGLSEQEYLRLEKDLFHPENATAAGGDDYFVLTDTMATIRRYYDVREVRDIKRLVEHIALLLPLKKDRELIFKRELEK